MEFQSGADKKDKPQFVWELTVFEGGVPNPEDIAPDRLPKDDGPLMFQGMVPDVENLDQLQQSIKDFCCQQFSANERDIVSWPPITKSAYGNHIWRAWFHVSVKHQIYTVFARKTQNLEC